jgi:hypothetical protein
MKIELVGSFISEAVLDMISQLLQTGQEKNITQF